MDSPTQQHATKEYVIVVHGTFATDASEVGSKWWQRGSDVFKDLESRLPSWATLGTPGGPFRWSGENSHIARYVAGADLLGCLIELEKKDLPYHLVAHSHGGSVVQAALIHAIERREFIAKTDKERMLYELKNLRTWTTVATPFLRLAPSDAMGRSWVGVGLGLLAVTMIAAGVVVGARALDGSSEPTWAWTLGSIISILAGGLLSGIAVGRGQTIHFAKLSIIAGQRFGARWLGLWAVQDEAINGIKYGGRKMTGPVLPRMHGPLRTSGVGLMHDLLGAATTLVGRLVYNGLIAPLTDAVLRRVVPKASYGIDLPGIQQWDVGPAPVPFRRSALNEAFSLPLPVSSQVLAVAATKSVERLQTMRELLWLTSGASGAPNLARDLRLAASADALVHNSYFAVPDVRALIAAHIRWSRNEQAIDGCLGEWVA